MFIHGLPLSLIVLLIISGSRHAWSFSLASWAFPLIVAFVSLFAALGFYAAHAIGEMLDRCGSWSNCGRRRFWRQLVAFRSSLVDLHTQLTYEKQLRNLHLQESRLHRRREKDLAAFRQAQSYRRNRDTNILEAAARLLIQAKRAIKPFDAHSHCPAFLNEVNTQLGGGFEFSPADIEAYSSRRTVLDIAYGAFKRDSAARNRMQTAACTHTASVSRESLTKRKPPHATLTLDPANARHPRLTVHHL